MDTPSRFGDISVAIDDEFVAIVEIHRPPNNFFDQQMVSSLADAFETLDRDTRCRALVLASEGKAFCAGADFGGKPRLNIFEDTKPTRHLYREAVRLFRTRKPVVAAVHGPAVGGGLGLALMADFRVTCDEARFCANFARLGLHCGFGISVTLPRTVGEQKAAELLYTGRRISGTEAAAIGLADKLVPQNAVRSAAIDFAREIALSAPFAVMSMRETLRRGLADAIEAATEREGFEQQWQVKSADFAEGTAAMHARRTPRFRGA